MNAKKPDDWMDTAERLGNQIARGLETFGDRVQKALEHLDDVGRPRPGGVTIEDERDAEGGVPVETLLRGDVFEHQGQLFMRLGAIPNVKRVEEIDAVNLKNGDVRLFSRGVRVEPVDARVVVRDKSTGPAKDA